MITRLSLLTNTGDVWLPEHEYLLQFVSEERRERIVRYRFDADRILSLEAAILARLGIARELGVPADSLRFQNEPNHKPILDPTCAPGADTMDVSVSHTKGAVLCGIAQNSSIGVDIEAITTPPYEIMPLSFHPAEIAYIERHTGPDKTRAFYQVWTQKEAYTKCLGTGLITDLCAINTCEASYQTKLQTWKQGDYMCSVYHE